MDYEKGLTVLTALLAASKQERLAALAKELRSHLRDEQRYGPCPNTSHLKYRCIEQLIQLASPMSFTDACLGKLDKETEQE